MHKHSLKIVHCNQLTDLKLAFSAVESGSALERVLGCEFTNSVKKYLSQMTHGFRKILKYTG